MVRSRCVVPYKKSIHVLEYLVYPAQYFPHKALRNRGLFCDTSLESFFTVPWAFTAVSTLFQNHPVFHLPRATARVIAPCTLRFTTAFRHCTTVVPRVDGCTAPLGATLDARSARVVNDPTVKKGIHKNVRPQPPVPESPDHTPSVITLVHYVCRGGTIACAWKVKSLAAIGVKSRPLNVQRFGYRECPMKPMKTKSAWRRNAKVVTTVAVGMIILCPCDT